MPPLVLFFFFASPQNVWMLVCETRALVIFFVYFFSQRKWTKGARNLFYVRVVFFYGKKEIKRGEKKSFSLLCWYKMKCKYLEFLGICQCTKNMRRREGGQWPYATFEIIKKGESIEHSTHKFWKCAFAKKLWSSWCAHKRCMMQKIVA